jgi:hypothetical protein
LERLGIVALEEKPNGRKVPTVRCSKVQVVLDFVSRRPEAA